MLSVVYTSTAAMPFSDAALLTLLEQSREKNASLGITGLLLYKEDHFMQALEGPEDAVRALYATIARDRRHFDVLVLLEERIDQRHFPGWAMGYRALTDEVLLTIPGYSVFLDDRREAPAGQDATSPAAVWGDTSGALWLLQWFRRLGV